MDRAALVALVVGYENLIPKLTLPDENDRHVLAAAIRGKAQVIVTMNLKDFPAEVLQKYDTEAQHPDEFILRLIDLACRVQGILPPGQSYAASDAEEFLPRRCRRIVTPRTFLLRRHPAG